MLEIDAYPENLKIPENWKFRERNEGNALKVIHLDKDESYLAFSIPNRRGWRSGWRSIEYFFSKDGLPLLARAETILPTIAIHKWGEDEVHTQCGFGDRPRPYIYVGFSRLEDLDEQPRSAKNFYNASNIVCFTDTGAIDKVCLLSPYFHGPDPDIELLGFHDREVSYYTLDLHGLKILDQEQPNKLVFVNNADKKEYVVVWNTIIEEDREGKQVPFFVVTKSHFDADNEETRKILRSPIQIDADTVRSALLSEQPYPKGDKGRFVSLRDTDRLFGVTFSYSFPPPKKP